MRKYLKSSTVTYTVEVLLSTGQWSHVSYGDTLEAAITNLLEELSQRKERRMIETVVKAKITSGEALTAEELKEFFELYKEVKTFAQEMVKLNQEFQDILKDKPASKIITLT